MKTNNQPSKNETSVNNIEIPGNNKGAQRLALSTCKTILNEGGVSYSDDEILAIRDFLYQLAGFAAEQQLLEEEHTKIEPEQLNHARDEKSLFVCPGKYGRAGRKRVQPAPPGRKVKALLPVEQR